MKIYRRLFLYMISAAAAFGIAGSGGAAAVRETPANAGCGRGEEIAVGAKEEGRVMLIPGGCPFGVKIYSDGLTVVGFGKVETASGVKEPAMEAGVKINDVITELNGEKTATAEEFVSAISAGGGAAVELRIRRGERDLKINVVPELAEREGKWRLGLFVKDSAAGIGTLTYVEPETLAFGGLGHGICDGTSGELVVLARGSIADVKISSVVRGECGTPGELKGSFVSGRRGALTANTESGIFGVYSSLPDALSGCTAVEAAKRDEVREGDATVLCTLGGDGIRAYGIRISAISNEEKTSKSFSVTVTDGELIGRTGGIVQGMSGSPIMQDGRLVGAVTHVLISDPTRGYGIFIGDMLGRAG